MKVMRVLQVLVIVLVLSSCTNGSYDVNNNNENKAITIEEKQINYIEQLGYNLVESYGVIDTYILEKKMLIDFPFMEIWGLQKLDPKEYFGKSIDSYSYIVNNHKLDNYGDKGQTHLWLLVCEEEIIGGYSLQDNSEHLYGGVYSIVGLTLEEVTKMNYQEWLDEWIDKYGEVDLINKKPLDYHNSYAEMLGYDENIPSFDPIEEEAKLIYGLDEVTSFYETYIQSRELPMDQPDESSSLLFIQFKGDKFSATSYSIRDVYISGNDLTVEVREIGQTELHPVEGFNGYFSYVIILEVDRGDVNKSMKLNVIVTAE